MAKAAPPPVKCVRCSKDVAPHERPQDKRDPALCGHCQRVTQMLSLKVDAG